jgi:hypothetical protein
MMQFGAANTIEMLARNAENASSIAAAGAIPLLVQLLDPGDGPPALMQGTAAQTLGYLAVNAEDAVTIVDAGAVPLLVQLLKPGPRVDVQQVATGALAHLGTNAEVAQRSAVEALSGLAANAENAVTIASSGAIPPLAQLLRNNATKDVAARALEAIRRGIAANRAAVAAAKASADVAHEMEGLGIDIPSDVQTS